MSGVRKVQKIPIQKIVDIIIEEPVVKEEWQMNNKVLEQYNPLITNEQLRIIEAAVPKHTMKQLLGLTNMQFLVFKNTERWAKTRQKQASK